MAETEREQQIRERAHAIWEEEGRPEGRDAEHWERAGREIEAEGDRVAPPATASGGSATIHRKTPAPGGG